MSKDASREQIEQACRLVAARGRAYITKRRQHYLTQVQFFSKDVVELDLLCLVFGGNHYHHLAGRTWMLQKKSDVKRLAEIVEPYLQENPNHGLQILYQPPQAPT